MKRYVNELNGGLGQFTRMSLLLLLCLGVAPPGVAQEKNSQPPTNTTQMPLKEALKPESEKSAFSIAGQIANESNLQSAESTNRESQTVLTLLPAWEIGVLKLSLTSELSKEQQGEEKLAISDTRVSLTHKPLELIEGLSTRSRVSYIAPTNEDSIEKDRLKSAGSLEGFLKQDLRRWSVPLVIEYRLGYRQNIHEYNINSDGDPNLQWIISQLATIGIEIIEGLEITIEGLWRNARTYKNFERTDFSVSEEISWEVTKNWSLFVGHSNRGSLQPAERQGSSLKAFDEKSSVIHGGIGFEF